MKRYLLDTSLVAAFLHGRKHVIELIDPWVRKQEAGTSILVYGEVIEYLKGLADYSRYQARLQRLFTLEQITPYPLTYPILERYADIRRTLRSWRQNGEQQCCIVHRSLGECFHFIARYRQMRRSLFPTVFLIHVLRPSKETGAFAYAVLLRQ